MNDVISALLEAIPGAKIDPHFNGAYVKLKISAPIFNSMKMVEQHRFVKSILAPWVNDGTIHALELEIKGLEVEDACK